jgi:hypothetical protein
VNLINPDWNFEQMGIGGLDKEFRTIFRRAFASRVFPPDLVAQLGIQHVRGAMTTYAALRSLIYTKNYPTLYLVRDSSLWAPRVR